MLLRRLHFATTFLTWAVNLSPLSMMTPRNLYSVVVLVGVVGVVVGVGVTNRVPTQNLRTVVGIDLLFFLIDWYE